MSLKPFKCTFSAKGYKHEWQKLSSGYQLYNEPLIQVDKMSHKSNFNIADAVRKKSLKLLLFLVQSMYDFKRLCLRFSLFQRMIKTWR